MKILKFIFGYEAYMSMFRYVYKFSIITLLRKNGAKVGSDCDIEPPIIFHNCVDLNKLEIGNNCHIGKNCFFDLKDKIIIGNNVVISMQSSFYTHIDMNKSELKKNFPMKSGSIEIKDNVYIGANSIIHMGLIINNNSIIASGSIVLKGVEANTLVGGVPAKYIKNIK